MSAPIDDGARPTTVIPIEKVVVTQNVRSVGGDRDIFSLMSSIERSGLLQPIGAKETPAGEYVLMWGHRRLEAMRKLGYRELVVGKHIRVFQGDLSEEDFLVTNVVENIQRRDITPIELGRVAYYLNKEKGMSSREIAIRLASPPGRVEEAIRLFLETPDAYKSEIGYSKGGRGNRSGKIPASLVSWVVRNIPPSQREDMLAEIKRRTMPMTQLVILKELISAGLTLEEALNQVSKYRAVYVQVLVDNAVALDLEEEHKMPIGDVIRWFLQSGVRPRRDLVFNPESASSKSKSGKKEEEEKEKKQVGVEREI